MPPISSPAAPPRRALSPLARWAYAAAAVLCLALGVVGLVVPGLPSTVFILLASAAAARSSPRLHHWLWQHRWFGPMLRDWAQGGRVSRRSKWHATLAMAMSAALLLLVPVPWWARALALGSMAVVLTWLWLRPESR